MTDDPAQLIALGVLQEHRFESHVPVLGPFIARLRFAWYSVAARWGDQSLIHQQTAYNQAAVQRMAELTQHIAEDDQHIAEHDRRIAEYDQRLILADRDLTDLTRTVAELTQQVIELRHRLAEAQAARTRP